jgi:primosomal protein N' (replication factor Y)
MPLPIVVQVVVDKPLAQGFDYLWDEAALGVRPEVGTIVEVPFGRTRLVGVIIKVSTYSEFDIDKLKAVTRVAPLPPLDPAVLRLMNFASQYYIHALGETIIPTIPQMWKKSDDWEKIPKKLAADAEKKKKKSQIESGEGFIDEEHLNDGQKLALERLHAIPVINSKPL